MRPISIHLSTLHEKAVLRKEKEKEKMNQESQREREKILYCGSKEESGSVSYYSLSGGSGGPGVFSFSFSWALTTVFGRQCWLLQGSFPHAPDFSGWERLSATVWKERREKTQGTTRLPFAHKKTSGSCRVACHFSRSAALVQFVLDLKDPLRKTKKINTAKLSMLIYVQHCWL